ncbi:sodium-dependent bicarbonate transport family permease [Phaeobacter sp. PT47_59]|uniref:sodium-dependent bicarbonate transport family permease n=1 Tax=Phaeobacter sp. PT47_59 TaxID=3029979 RepID=UPI0023809E4E|nr:sodium-dependent bicarbonate transport family permease [Phaeobacter sp. PT47_59]MDE4173378.1 sodium-dependent bicarbonate transport family permease [Phaeobacter sp. PT47_59]
MAQIIDSLAGNLLVPTILFFALGLAAAFARSDLSIPSGAAKFMSIYLLLAIGFKGGASLAQHGLSPDLFATLAAGVLLSFVIPFVAFGLLKVMTRLNTLNAAALAGHYGSISIVTFVTATSLLELGGIAYEGYMVAVAAAMEVPAILSALWLAHRRGGEQQDTPKGLWRDLLANGSIVLLVGAFTIGAITGEDGLATISPFIIGPFTGILCLFLLDMGLAAGRSLISNRGQLTPGLFAFGVTMPVIGALMALALARLTGLSDGGSFLFMVLAASASYIAVPAAMRIALPRAEPGIYLSMSLGVTFPFNITVGLPLYLWLAQASG